MNGGIAFAFRLKECLANSAINSKEGFTREGRKASRRDARDAEGETISSVKRTTTSQLKHAIMALANQQKFNGKCG
ncbi:MAG: hypothetical protein COA78_28660 [Blastopirellula sp.]|nr:MAG: hypothetical protein COA78_28660 [Blastopirellula sp.]